MGNLKTTMGPLKDFLEQLASEAGHEPASTRLMSYYDARLDDEGYAFEMTDENGNRFQGSVPGDWLTIPLIQLREKMIEKYPMAFTPRRTEPVEFSTREMLIKVRDDIDAILARTKDWK